MELGLDAVRARVAGARTVAVLGANVDPSRPAHYVPAALHAAGLTVLPVNARFAGQQLFGRTIVARLDELRVPVDIVDVFRVPQMLAGHLAEIAAMAPRPGLVWLQSGIRSDGFVHDLAAHGIDVVQDRCLMVDHRAWGWSASQGSGGGPGTHGAPGTRH
jgi:predicted CoA-binding protein